MMKHVRTAGSREPSRLRRRIHAREVLLPDHLDPLRKLIRQSDETYADIARRRKQVEILQRNPWGRPVQSRKANNALAPS
jgi:hypothetical protein